YLPFAVFIFGSKSAAWKGHKMPTAEDFRRELFHMMANAQNSGRESIEISARELHARVSPSSERAFECQVCWHDSSSTVLNLCALRVNCAADMGRLIYQLIAVRNVHANECDISFWLYA